MPTTYYWIANSGSWTSASHWSLSSGGAATITYPGQLATGDTAIFDSNSFSSTNQTVTYNYAGAYGFTRVDFSGVTNAPTLDLDSSVGMKFIPYAAYSGTLTCAFNSNMTITNANSIATSIAFSSTAGDAATGALDAQGVTMPNNVVVSTTVAGASACKITLLSDYVGNTTDSTSTLTMNGALDLNGHNFAINAISTYNSSARLVLGTGIFHVASFYFQNTYLNSGTSTLQIDNAGSIYAATNALHLYNVQFLGDGTISGDNGLIVYFNNIAATAGHTLTFKYQLASIYVNNFTGSGTALSKISLRSTSTGHQYLLFASGSPISVSYYDVKDSNGQVDGSFTDVNGINSGNNAHWSFDYAPQGSDFVSTPSASASMNYTIQAKASGADVQGLPAAVATFNGIDAVHGTDTNGAGLSAATMSGVAEYYSGTMSSVAVSVATFNGTSIPPAAISGWCASSALMNGAAVVYAAGSDVQGTGDSWATLEPKFQAYGAASATMSGGAGIFAVISAAAGTATSSFTGLVTYLLSFSGAGAANGLLNGTTRIYASGADVEGAGAASASISGRAYVYGGLSPATGTAAATHAWLVKAYALGADCAGTPAATATLSYTLVTMVYGTFAGRAAASATQSYYIYLAVYGSFAGAGRGSSKLVGVRSLLGGLTNNRTYFFNMGAYCYLMDGVDYWRLDSGLNITKLSQTVTVGTTQYLPAANMPNYIPTVFVGQAPQPAYNVSANNYESFNLIGSGYKVSYIGDGVSGIAGATPYYIPFRVSGQSLDIGSVTLGIPYVSATYTDTSFFPPVVHNWTEISSPALVVDRTNGSVTFPIKPVKGNGVDNVVVTVYQTHMTDVAKITGNQIQPSIFGGDNDSRVFLANGNIRYNSGLYDPTYWPDDGWTAIGSSYSDITALTSQIDTQVILKGAANDEPTIYASRYQANTDSNNIEYVTFPVFPINSIAACDAPDSVQIIENNPTFLDAEHGVYSLTTSNVRDQRVVQRLSDKINKAILAEATLSAATSFLWKYRYGICVNGDVYVYDYRQSAWYGTWTNVYASCFIGVGESLYFGSSQTGKVYKFNPVYHDETIAGIATPIYAAVSTKYLDFDSPEYTKLLSRIFYGLKPFARTSVIATFATNNNPTPQPLSFSSTSLFDYAYFDYSKMSYSATAFPHESMRKVHAKKVVWVQVNFSNSNMDEAMGILNVGIQYVPQSIVKTN